MRALRSRRWLPSVVAAGLACGLACLPGERLARGGPPPRDPFAGLAPLGPSAPRVAPLRPGPTPPPAPTRVERLAFPPPAPPAPPRRPSARVAPLRVLRTQPTGETGLTGAVTVTFDQPMVPVAALAELARSDAPLRLTPTVPGRFRWLGTETLAFEPEGRLPYGTDFTAVVPAGTRATSGATLAREVRFRFSTPRPVVTRALPHAYSGQARPDTAVAIELNQRVAPAELLRRLTWRGLSAADLEVVPRAAWGRLPELGPALLSWDPERTIVLRPRRPLPLAAWQRLTVAAGLRGEGSRPSARAWHHQFSTYHPLAVEEIRCGDPYRCNPARGFQVRFNNPLRLDAGEPRVEISPVPPDLAVEPGARWVVIRGDFAARTAYTIRVAAGAVDVHGQTLAAPARRTLRTGDVSPDLRFPVRGLASLERGGKRLIPLEVRGVGTARLRLVRVAPEALLTALRKARRPWGYGGRGDPLRGVAGRRVARTLRTGVRRNGTATLGLATDEGLGPGGAGPLFVELRSGELRRENRWASPYRTLLVQVTDIGVMARYDADQIVARATGLESGVPLAGARVTLRDRDGVVIWTGATGADGVVRAPGRRTLLPAGGAAPPRPHQAPWVLWVERGDDRAFLVLEGRGDDGQYLHSYSRYGAVPPTERLSLHLFTDRSPYRPGDTVHVKGVLRVSDTRPRGGLGALAGAREVEYEVRSARGHRVAKGRLTLTASGSFTFDVALAPGADLGRYRVRLRPTAGPFQTWGEGSFEVAAYRAPELAVKVEVEGEPHFLGDTLRARVGADYLFGAPMAGAACSWTLSRQAARFDPPGNEGFVFGEPVAGRPDWRLRRGPRRFRGGLRVGSSFQRQAGDGEVVASGVGVLDARGRLAVATRLAPDPAAGVRGPVGYTLEAQVVDRNRQAVAGRRTVVAHPAARYVGLRARQAFVRAGEAVTISGVVVDLAGRRVRGQRLTLAAVEVRTKVTTVREEGRWVYRYEDAEVPVGSCPVTTSDRPESCPLRLPRPGRYRVQAAITDARGRPTRTALWVYAAGPGYVPWRLENQGRVELVPDRPEYRPGETARLLVKAPIGPAVGLLTIMRDGIDRAVPLRLDGTAQVIEVPIAAHHVPAVWVGVALARGRVTDGRLGAAAEDLGRPAFAQGRVRLPVALVDHRVDVAVAPARPRVRPGDPLTVRLRTTAGGRPVRAELAVMVVDEGVLALLGYETPDPLTAFFPDRPPGAPLVDLRDALLGARPDLVDGGRGRGRRRGARGPLPRELRRDPAVLGALSRAKAGDDGALRAETDAPDEAETALDATAARSTVATGHATGGGGEAGAVPIRARAHFATTAFFAPAVATDAGGRAEVRFALPDNLTTYRIMAVALDRDRSDRFGRGQAQVQVRKPLLLRPSLPRFLTVGDRFEASVTVHNETGRDGTVLLLARGRNVGLRQALRREIAVRNGQAREVRFPMAVEHAGPARVQLAAVLGAASDATEIQVPVLLPVTTEAFATYGVTDGVVRQPVVPPKDALQGYGGLEISLASTALNGLEDAVRYLVEYPHECTEQTASRMLPIVSLGPILADFRLAGLTDLAAQKALAARGVARLLAQQRGDGGWGYWDGSRRSWPWISSYAAFALARARKAGYAVPARDLARARQFLTWRLDHPLTEYFEHRDYVSQTAMAWTLAELGAGPRGHLGRLYGHRRQLPLFARAWLMTALHRVEGRSRRVRELLREIENAAVQTAATARFAEARTESLRVLMHSEDRTDAIVLGALLEVAPDSPLVPKVVRGLLDGRVRGAWSTTQANAFALVALGRYYARGVERQVPDFAAQVWYGAGHLGSAAFRGREMKSVRREISLDALRNLGPRELVLARQGRGALFYRLALRYAPASLRLPAEEQGFAVSRVYEPIAGPRGAREATVRRRRDGSWAVKAGATVRVRVVLVVPDQRYFVAVTDPLPAGLEPVDLRFATEARSRLGNQLDDRTYDAWSLYALLAFDHRELRDDRVVLYADRLPAGVYEYTYLARATSLGRFVVAPTKAEEMYHAETFGRAATTTLEVRP